MKKLDICDPCPTCGKRLMVAGLTGRYLHCNNGHTHERSVNCQAPGCRRKATAFYWRIKGDRAAYCADHDDWPYIGPTKGAR